MTKKIILTRKITLTKQQKKDISLKLRQMQGLESSKAKTYDRSNDKSIIARTTFLRMLLREFGATLSGFDPGVTAILKVKGRIVRGRGFWGESMNFDGTEWSWLEPLLMELYLRRKGKYDERISQNTNGISPRPRHK
jgi:hypothetical protein